MSDLLNASELLNASSFGDASASQRPPILVLHGLFGSSRNWDGIARTAAAAGRRVFALDLPNHGRSPWTDAPMSYPAMSEAVETWMDAQGIASAVVLGHSMGGKTAMRLALSRPARVEALIVVDIAPIPYVGGAEHLGYIRALQNVPLETIERRSDLERALKPSIASPSIRRFLAQNLEAREDGTGWRWRINLPILAASLPALMDFPLFETEDPYFGPTLFVAGGRSNYIQPAHAPAMAHLFPRHRLDVVPAAEHWVHAEHPLELMRALHDFLDGEML